MSEPLCTCGHDKLRHAARSFHGIDCCHICSCKGFHPTTNDEPSCVHGYEHPALCPTCRGLPDYKTAFEKANEAASVREAEIVRLRGLLAECHAKLDEPLNTDLQCKLCGAVFACDATHVCAPPARSRADPEKAIAALRTEPPLCRCGHPESYHGLHGQHEFAPAPPRPSISDEAEAAWQDWREETYGPAGKFKPNPGMTKRQAFLAGFRAARGEEA